jgi:hypothetical protein
MPPHDQIRNKGHAQGLESDEIKGTFSLPSLPVSMNMFIGDPSTRSITTFEDTRRRVVIFDQRVAIWAYFYAQTIAQTCDEGSGRRHKGSPADCDNLDKYHSEMDGCPCLFNRRSTSSDALSLSTTDYIRFPGFDIFCAVGQKQDNASITSGLMRSAGRLLWKLRALLAVLALTYAVLMLGAVVCICWGSTPSQVQLIHTLFNPLVVVYELLIVLMKVRLIRGAMVGWVKRK